ALNTFFQNHLRTPEYSLLPYTTLFRSTTASANDDAPRLPGQGIDDVTRVAVDTAQGVRRERALELQAQERQARQHGRDAAIVPRRAGLIEDAERSQVRHVRPIACREDY